MLALNNGLAIEELADPGSVPADTIGTVLVRLLGLQSPTPWHATSREQPYEERA